MTFSPNEGAIITLAEGAKMTANYRATISAGDTLAHAVGKNLFNSILNQASCVGIRIYYALNENGEKQLVLVGVDSDGNDLTAGVIVDRTKSCPTSCSLKNPLNS